MNTQFYKTKKDMLQTKNFYTRNANKGFIGRKFITPKVVKKNTEEPNANLDENIIVENPENKPIQEYPFGVSVCISAWKTAEYIEECLDSVAAQTWFKDHNNYEILLGVDGCEETLEKVKEIMHKYKNLKVMMMDKNVGTYITSNTIMKEAKYELLLRFDSDDIMNPNMVEVMVEKIKNNKYDLISACAKSFGLTKNVISSAQGVILIRKPVFSKFGGYRPWVCAADTELKKRLLKLISIVNIKDVLFNRRVHKNSLTNKKETNMKSKIRKKYHDQIKTANTVKEGVIEYTTTTFTTIN